MGSVALTVVPVEGPVTWGGLSGTETMLELESSLYRLRQLQRVIEQGIAECGGEVTRRTEVAWAAARV